MQSEKYLLKDRDSFPRAMKRRRIMILPSSHRSKHWGRLWENLKGVRCSWDRYAADRLYSSVMTVAEGKYHEKAKRYYGGLPLWQAAVFLHTNKMLGSDNMEQNKRKRYKRRLIKRFRCLRCVWADRSSGIVFCSRQCDGKRCFIHRWTK